MAKALALYSGGLDSTLAILIVKSLGVDVLAVKFLTKFGCADTETNHETSQKLASEYGFDLITEDISDKFIQIVLAPQYGYGKNLNPCIDCKVLMLKEAKALLDKHNCQFIITGEVVGQRPMSQMRDTLRRIQKLAGVTGLVLRPLSAKLLEETAPEILGLIDREKLYSIAGRSRKKQLELAQSFNLKHYQTPSGGCLLTEPNFAYRLREHLKHTAEIDLRDIELLRYGRHFRTPHANKLIVGRNKSDNASLQALAKSADILLRALDTGSPTSLLRVFNRDFASLQEDIILSASIVARYSDAKDQKFVKVEVIVDGAKNIITVTPAEKEQISKMLIVCN